MKTDKNYLNKIEKNICHNLKANFNQFYSQKNEEEEEDVINNNVDVFDRTANNSHNSKILKINEKSRQKNSKNKSKNDTKNSSDDVINMIEFDDSSSDIKLSRKGKVDFNDLYEEKSKKHLLEDYILKKPVDNQKRIITITLDLGPEFKGRNSMDGIYMDNMKKKIIPKQRNSLESYRNKENKNYSNLIKNKKKLIIDNTSKLLFNNNRKQNSNSQRISNQNINSMNMKNNSKNKVAKTGLNCNNDKDLNNTKNGLFNINNNKSLIENKINKYKEKHKAIKSERTNITSDLINSSRNFINKSDISNGIRKNNYRTINDNNYNSNNFIKFNNKINMYKEKYNSNLNKLKIQKEQKLNQICTFLPSINNEKIPNNNDNNNGNDGNQQVVKSINVRKSSLNENICPFNFSNRHLRRSLSQFLEDQLAFQKKVERKIAKLRLQKDIKISNSLRRINSFTSNELNPILLNKRNEKIMNELKEQRNSNILISSLKDFYIYNGNDKLGGTQSIEYNKSINYNNNINKNKPNLISINGSNKKSRNSTNSLDNNSQSINQDNLYMFRNSLNNIDNIMSGNEQCLFDKYKKLFKIELDKILGRKKTSNELNISSFKVLMFNLHFLNSFNDNKDNELLNELIIELINNRNNTVKSDQIFILTLAIIKLYEYYLLNNILFDENGEQKKAISFQDKSKKLYIMNILNKNLNKMIKKHRKFGGFDEEGNYIIPLEKVNFIQKYFTSFYNNFNNFYGFNKDLKSIRIENINLKKHKKNKSLDNYFNHKSNMNLNLNNYLKKAIKSSNAYNKNENVSFQEHDNKDIGFIADTSDSKEYSKSYLEKKLDTTNNNNPNDNEKGTNNTNTNNNNNNKINSDTGDDHLNKNEIYENICLSNGNNNFDIENNLKNNKPKDFENNLDLGHNLDSKNDEYINVLYQNQLNNPALIKKKLNNQQEKKRNLEDNELKINKINHKVPVTEIPNHLNNENKESLKEDQYQIRNNSTKNILTLEEFKEENKNKNSLKSCPYNKDYFIKELNNPLYQNNNITNGELIDDPYYIKDDKNKKENDPSSHNLVKDFNKKSKSNCPLIREGSYKDIKKRNVESKESNDVNQSENNIMKDNDINDNNNINDINDINNKHNKDLVRIKEHNNILINFKEKESDTDINNNEKNGNAQEMLIEENNSSHNTFIEDKNKENSLNLNDVKNTSDDIEKSAQLLIEIDVNLKNKEKKKLLVFEGDTPRSLAKKFSQENGLDDVTRIALENIIKSEIDDLENKNKN